MLDKYERSCYSHLMSKGQQTKDEILRQAFRLASLKGLDGLSIGSLAKEVGMSKSGLFAHFNSKENLQIDVLQWLSEKFVADVIAPAVKAPRGEPRLRTLFKNWLAWHDNLKVPGGCVFISAASEFDDQPGLVKEHLQASQSGLIDSIARMARGAIEEGHFRADLDADQFAFELYSLILGYHHYKRLLGDADAHSKLETAFERKMSESKR